MLGEGDAFDFKITPEKMSIPKDQRAFFEVTLTPKQAVKTGNYPISFRLVGGGRLFKTFSLNAGGDAKPADTGAPAGGGARAKGLGVPSTPDAPVLDGKITDAAWKKAAVLANFSLSGGGQPVYNTTGLLLHDTKNLYLAFHASDENVEGLGREDAVTVRFSSGDDPGTVFSAALSGNGDILLAKTGADSKSVAWTAAGIRSALGKAGRTWTVEFAVPFAAMGAPAPAAGTEWHLRVERTKATGNPERSYWAADGSGYNSEKGLGELVLDP
jgi:hypothetical protein